MVRRIDLIGLALVLTGYGLSASYSLGQPLAAPAAKPGMPETSAPSVRAELVDPVNKAATAAKLSFHELARGKHKITVTLVGSDHLPVATPVVLSLTVP